MNIVTAIRALFQAKTVVGELKPVPKTGFVSSEFWRAIFIDGLLIAGVVNHYVDPNIAAIISGVMTVAYMGVRLFLKAKHIDLGKIDGLDDLTPDQIVSLFQTLTTKTPTVTVLSGTAATGGVTVTNIPPAA